MVVPYVCLAVFVLGHVWRYRYDKFGWTTRSSQMYERRLLRWGSPLFHFGILAVFLGHVMGLGVPKSWTEAVGISEGVYHFLAVSVGAVAGFCTVVGLAILIYRRRTVGPGVQRDHPHGQDDVRLPRRGDPAGPVEHRRQQHLRPLRLPRRACRCGSAASSGSTCTPS